jgi:hypothetical protein
LPTPKYKFLSCLWYVGQCWTGRMFYPFFSLLKNWEFGF